MLGEFHHSDEFGSSFRRGCETDSASGAKSRQIDSDSQRYFRFVGLLMLFGGEIHSTKPVDLVAGPLTAGASGTAVDGDDCVTAVRYHEIIHEGGDRYGAKELCHGCESLGNSAELHRRGRVPHGQSVQISVFDSPGSGVKNGHY